MAVKPKPQPKPRAPSRRGATPSTLYIGLMSGTSTDGVDAVLADLRKPGQPKILSSVSLPMPEALRQEFLALNDSGPDELHRAALAGNNLAELYRQAVYKLLEDAHLTAKDINAIGAHGQTVRHMPRGSFHFSCEEGKSTWIDHFDGYTWQLNNPAWLAEHSGIDVIADFRARDIVAGGQGAPLVPAFHAAMWSGDAPRAVLNLGGIANVTVLRPKLAPQGFDTGPANMLLDAWIQKCCGQSYDKDGQWAASGTSNPALLRLLIDSEPWFAAPPPKSTGRDRFNYHWLNTRINDYQQQRTPWYRKGFQSQYEDPQTKLQRLQLHPQDMQATLQSLTVQTIAHALKTWAPEIRDIVVCGGGARNPNLMAELAANAPAPLIPSGDLGVSEQYVEALAFAWLAWAWRHKKTAGLPSVTGARHASVLGCCYPA